MCALGRKGGLAEAAIITYIRRGINNTGLQNALACVEIKTLNELHNALSRYNENVAHVNRTPQQQSTTTILPTMKPNENNLPSAATISFTKSTLNTEEKSQRGALCYNCFGRGYISRACPMQQRRERCSICSKSGHRDEVCPTKPSATVMTSGSCRSLIRRSCANKLGRATTCSPLILQGFWW